MNNHMSISVWGPLAWDWLHNLAICYPHHPTENDKFFHYLKIKKFIETLPCAKCKHHSIDYIKNISPIDLTNNKKFQYWVFHFHNSVNALKKKYIFTIQDYNRKYRTNLSY
jgi:FAD-linked sulfhydryl oxidase